MSVLLTTTDSALSKLMVKAIPGLRTIMPTPWLYRARVSFAILESRSSFRVILEDAGTWRDSQFSTLKTAAVNAVVVFLANGYRYVFASVSPKVHA